MISRGVRGEILSRRWIARARTTTADYYPGGGGTGLPGGLPGRGLTTRRRCFLPPGLATAPEFPG